MFKKDVLVDGQSHLLLIREEPDLPDPQVSPPPPSPPPPPLYLLLLTPAAQESFRSPHHMPYQHETVPLPLPDPQFCSWVDGVILVFSLENESSFLEVYNIYRQLGLHRNIAEVPFIVVGTQVSPDDNAAAPPTQCVPAKVLNPTSTRAVCVAPRVLQHTRPAHTSRDTSSFIISVPAQKIVAMKRQLALYASCKSLPNSPSHSGGSTPLSGAFPGQASNGGQSSDYSSSLPSTPVISHKDISGTSGGEKLGSATPVSLRSHGRTARFT
ncbi:hypothetical protein NFI96_003624, partial [Prochilodus magdalenae]